MTRSRPKLIPLLILFPILILLFTPPPLHAEESETLPPDKKINFNPVPHDPATVKKKSKRREEVPDLRPITTLCDVGADHYVLHDNLDEERCSQRGGKIRGALGDGHQYPDIKGAPLPVRPSRILSPSPADNERIRNPHFNPLDNNP
jgi:hypothetical protein